MNACPHSIYCQEIDTICDPIKQLGITYFHYIKTYSSGARISLSNYADWMNYYYTNKLYKNPFINKNPFHNYNSCHLWHDNKDSEIFQQLKINFGIADGITLVDRNKQTCEFYYFGFNKITRADIKSFYLHKASLLKRFILYFKDKGHHIIEEAGKNKLFLEKNYTHSTPLSGHTKEIIQFIESTNIKYYRISTSSGSIKFTKKEFLCLRYMLQGCSAKETANHMEISYRTVETHLKNAKCKLKCYKKSEIYEILLQNNFTFLTEIAE